jgi:deoxycytidine triphosphate deaminase
MFKSGKFVKKFLENVDEKRVQSTGVDLTVGELYKVKDKPTIADDDYYKGEREKVEPNDDGFYDLDRGKYIIVYNETIEIPDNHVGFVFPRSRLLRSKAHITTAMWDPGYRGKGEGLLICDDIKIKENCGVAKMSFIEADPSGKYDGSHQEEKL